MQPVVSGSVRSQYGPDTPPDLAQDKWAKQYLLYEFYIFLVWLLSFQLFVWLFQVRSALLIITLTLTLILTLSLTLYRPVAHHICTS